jgi:hypothetical protein
MAERLSREDCVRYGGHCWVDDGVSGLIFSTGYTQEKRQQCRHCDYVRTGQSREAWAWTYAD